MKTIKECKQDLLALAGIRENMCLDNTDIIFRYHVLSLLEKIAEEIKNHKRWAGNQKMTEKMDYYRLGEKVLYIHNMYGTPQAQVVTIKKVGEDSHGFEVLYVEEFDGYIDSCEVYKKETLLEMFGEGKVKEE